jgi:hypothetical protein
VRDIVRVVVSYCKRHVVKGRVHVNEVEGGLEVVVFVEERGPMTQASREPASRKVDAPSE